MSIRMTVQLPIKAGKAAEFEAAAAPALARVRAEDAGCEMYDLFKSCDDDTRFVMVESQNLQRVYTIVVSCADAYAAIWDSLVSAASVSASLHPNEHEPVACRCGRLRQRR